MGCRRRLRSGSHGKEPIRQRDFVRFLGSTAVSWALGGTRAVAPQAPHRCTRIRSWTPPIAFNQRLQELGYIEGKNLIVDLARSTRANTFLELRGARAAARSVGKISGFAEIRPSAPSTRGHDEAAAATTPQQNGPDTSGRAVPKRLDVERLTEAARQYNLMCVLTSSGSSKFLEPMTGILSGLLSSNGALYCTLDLGT